MLRDSKSYETQLIDAVRSVNRALGGTYGTSSAIYKNEYNQFEVQLIDAIKGIGRTLSGKGLSVVGGFGGGASEEALQDLSRRVSKLENESFFRLVDGNVTLKEQYQNLWVPGWLAAGGIGSGGSSGGSVVTISNLLSSGTRIATITIDGTDYNILAPSGGGSGSVTSVAMTVPTGLSVSGSPITSSGTLAVSLASGYVIPQQSTLDNFVTLDGTQTITGAKAFTAPVSVDPSGNASSYIDIGNARLVYDAGANALHITKKSGSATVGLFADGFVAAGGVAGQSTTSYVDLDSAQTIGGNKLFTGTTSFNSDRYTLSINNDEINFESRLYIQYNSEDLCLTRSGKTIIGPYPGSTAIGSNKLYVGGSACFAGIIDTGYSSGHVVSIQDIVNRIVALENA